MKNLDQGARLTYRPGEVATLLGCSRTTAYELINSGKIPSIRIGNLLRVPADALEKLIAEGTNGAF